MLKFAVSVGISLISLVPGAAIARESGEAPQPSQQSVAFFCNQTPDTPETVLIIEQEQAIVIAPVLVWTPLYFADRESTLELCRTSALRLQALSATGNIDQNVFLADRQGESVRVCLQTEDTGNCTAETTVFATALPNRAELVLYEMLPANTRGPLTRGDFPTVHPAFPFNFFPFRF